jgi:hypothetical protein
MSRPTLGPKNKQETSVKANGSVCQLTFNGTYDIAFQKTDLITTTVRSSNPETFLSCTIPWLDSCPCCFTSGERNPDIHWTGRWLGPRAHHDNVVNGKIYFLCLKSLAIQLIACRCTKCAILMENYLEQKSSTWQEQSKRSNGKSSWETLWIIKYCALIALKRNKVGCSCIHKNSTLSDNRLILDGDLGQVDRYSAWSITSPSLLSLGICRCICNNR